MGLAISRRVVGELELRHLTLSDLEYTPNDQSSAPALGGRANWSMKVQVGRIFGADPHLHRQRRSLLSRLLHALLIMAAARLLHALLLIRRSPLHALLLIGVLVACKVYLLPVLRCSWASVALPVGITHIGQKKGQRLCEACIHVTLPASLTSIGPSAFANCDSLRSVALPASLTSIGPSAFANCDSLRSVALPASLTSIGPSAFASCDSLRSVALPDSLIWIGEHAFADSALLSVALPANLTSISPRAFRGCHSLNSVANLKLIGEHAFHVNPCLSQDSRKRRAKLTYLELRRYGRPANCVYMRLSRRWRKREGRCRSYLQS